MTQGKPMSAADLAAQAAANQQQRDDRIAAARSAAPADKEPLDLAAIKRSATTLALGVMDDAELTALLERIYYLDKPKLRSMAQLAAHVEELARWS